MDFREIIPTDFEEKLMRAAAKSGTAIPEALKAGAKILEVKIRQNTAAMVKNGTGDMLRSLKISGIKNSKKGTGKYITVAFTGKDSKGIANALKARVFECGKNGATGKGFISAAKLAALDETNKAMKETLEKIIGG